MKKKYYSWEECVNLREVKVLLNTYLSGALVVVMCYYILLYLVSDLLFPLLAVFTKNEPPKYCETEGSYSRKRHFVLCFWVHGEWLNFFVESWIGLYKRSNMLFLSIFGWCRSATYTNLWKTGKNCSLKVKLETGVFKFSKVLLTCISVVTSIVTLNLVLIHDFAFVISYANWSCYQRYFVFI